MAAPQAAESLPAGAEASASPARRRGSRPGSETLTKLVRYLLAGLVSLGADFTAYSVLVGAAGIDPLVANCFSRPLGGVVCFLLNKHWTFENAGKKGTAAQFASFWCVFAASMLLSEGLIWLGLHLGAGEYAAKIIAEGLVVIFNFCSLRYWTFR